MCVHTPTLYPNTHPLTTQIHTLLPPKYTPTYHPITHPLSTQLHTFSPPKYTPTLYPNPHPFSTQIHTLSPPKYTDPFCTQIHTHSPPKYTPFLHPSVNLTNLAVYRQSLGGKRPAHSLQNCPAVLMCSSLEELLEGDTYQRKMCYCKDTTTIWNVRVCVRACKNILS